VSNSNIASIFYRSATIARIGFYVYPRSMIFVSFDSQYATSY